MKKLLDWVHFKLFAKRYHSFIMYDDLDVLAHKEPQIGPIKEVVGVTKPFREWVDHTCVGRFRFVNQFVYGRLYFSHKEDAALFKLTWGNDNLV